MLNLIEVYIDSAVIKSDFNQNACSVRFTKEMDDELNQFLSNLPCFLPTWDTPNNLKPIFQLSNPVSNLRPSTLLVLLRFKF